MNGLKGKRVLIAGGGGIGAASARRIASEGGRVMLGDLNAEAARDVAEAISADGHDCVAMQYDQSDDASIAALVEAACDRFGGLDGVLVNAADMKAILSDGDLESIDMAVFDRTIEVNLRGSAMVARLALPAIRESRGAIVFMSSSAAHMGEPERVAYQVGKAGLNALVRHIASRWGKEGVTANAIAPGMVLTDQIRGNLPAEFQEQVLAAHRHERLGEPEDIAAMVALLMSGDGAWITGQVLAVDGGASIRP